jgi:hypothetical protein
VIWAPNQIFEKSDSEGRISKENCPFAFARNAAAHFRVNLGEVLAAVHPIDLFTKIGPWTTIPAILINPARNCKSPLVLTSSGLLRQKAHGKREAIMLLASGNASVSAIAAQFVAALEIH